MFLEDGEEKEEEEEGWGGNFSHVLPCFDKNGR